MLSVKNEMEILFDGVAENEGFARVAVAAFCTQLNPNEAFARTAAAAFAAQLDPTLEELGDIKTAVSEAVTNAIIHGYGNLEGYGGEGKQKLKSQPVHPGKVRLHCLLEDGILHIEIEDTGRGIEDVDKAMIPLYTSRPDLNRAGMGFALMEAFMDELEVESTPGQGTVVRMKKKMEAGDWIKEGD